MKNTVYQAAVNELEAILSPRIVSRALQEGLKQVGCTPETVGLAELDKILKVQIYRQLQINMPVVQAKEKVSAILGRLKGLRGDEPNTDGRSTAEGLKEQGARLASLREALRPFNLYFEWPEVQKLRALIQLLESEHDASREAPKLVKEAIGQLTQVEQKLEDQLVHQAQEIGELRTTLEQVKLLGGPKVRRLESLISQIEAAQENRQLAPAEVERARKLGTDLRKLMESSVIAETKAEGAREAKEPPPEGLLDVELDPEVLLTIDSEQLDAEANAKLLLIDLESERYELDQLERDNEQLLGYLPELRQRFTQLRQLLDEQVSVGEAVSMLKEDLKHALSTQRDALGAELQKIERELDNLHEEIDAADLRQAIQVAKGILSTTLPSITDVKHIRSLHRLIREQQKELAERTAAAHAAREAQLDEQAEVLARLESTLVRYQEEELSTDTYQALAQGIDALKQAQTNRTLVPEIVANARKAEEQLQSMVANQLQEESKRNEAELRRLFTQLQALPTTSGNAEVRKTLLEKLRQLLTSKNPPTITATQVKLVNSKVSELKTRTEQAIRQELASLTSRALDLGDQELDRKLAAAHAELEQGDYPDLRKLAAALGQAIEKKRREQMVELHQLEREVDEYRSAMTDDAAPLMELLTKARERLERGELATDMEQAWLRLEDLRSEMAERMTAFLPRLDRALNRFAGLEKLNSEDADTARRTLQLLDSQRDALVKISPKLQAQLESSLAEVEKLLDKIQEEFEATQAIANQLVSGNVLDSVLGPPFPSEDIEDIASLLEIPMGAETPQDHEQPEAPKKALNRVPNADPHLDGWLEPFLQERGVQGAAIFDRQGTMAAGAIPFHPPSLAQALFTFERDLEGISQELQCGDVQLLTLETSGTILISAWPLTKFRIVLLLDSPSVLSLVLHKLRRGLDELRDILNGPAFA